MEKIMEQEGNLQRQRASVPAFGEWDQMKAAGVLPDYSMDFTKIRAARMQRKSMPSLWSSAGSAPEVVGDGGGDDDERNHVKQHSEHGDDDRRHRHRHHRRQHSDATDLRRPLRPEAPKARSKVKDYLFGCVGGW